MSSMSATTRIAASETQPSSCSCARHRIAITAEACRPSGYFVISRFAHARFSSVNEKLAGCNSFGARRRTDICFSLSLQAARGSGVQRVDSIKPECACSTEYVVADVGRDLDAVKDRELGHGFQPTAGRIVDEQREWCLIEDIARDRVGAVAAVLFAQDNAVRLQQARAAPDGLYLDAFDVELDQVFPAGRDLAVIDQIVECDDRHVLAAAVGTADDAEGLVLGARQPRRTAHRADRALHDLGAIAIHACV